MDEIRRIPVALLVALIVQTIGGLVWAGSAAARIATLEDRVWQSTAAVGFRGVSSARRGGA